MSMDAKGWQWMLYISNAQHCTTIVYDMFINLVPEIKAKINSFEIHSPRFAHLYGCDVIWTRAYRDSVISRNTSSRINVWDGRKMASQVYIRAIIKCKFFSRIMAIYIVHTYPILCRRRTKNEFQAHFKWEFSAFFFLVSIAVACHLSTAAFLAKIDINSAVYSDCIIYSYRKWANFYFCSKVARAVFFFLHFLLDLEFVHLPVRIHGEKKNM